MATYLAGLQEMLRGLGVTCAVQIMESSGGSLSAALAAERPVATIESGGAAGVMAARVVGGWVGARDVFSFDMGGTTAKTAAVRGGEATLTYEFRVGESASVGDRRGAGLPIKTPVVDLAEIGAGGGSIAWVDRGGALQVGPQSAGAVPGPACYGRGGTRPTVTDANLVLGYLRAGELIRRRRVVGRLADDAITRRGQRPTRRRGRRGRARTIHDIVNTNMVAAIRIVTIQRGIDPRDFTLVGFGGAGPIHLARLADAFGIRQVVVPWAAGVASAIGLVAADPSVTQVRTTVIDAARRRSRCHQRLVHRPRGTCRQSTRMRARRHHVPSRHRRPLPGPGPPARCAGACGHVDRGLTSTMRPNASTASTTARTASTSCARCSS